ncbi:MAG: hypothetical protein K6G84_02550 [Lachnospiraceae bacterium]|nr:hypothetical protein [Lachnospiraceae bacterium]
MRIWFKEWENNRLLRDTVIEDYSSETRTHKIFNALEAACHEFDLATPLWLDSNVAEFKRGARTRFRKDSFIEEIPFDYLEMLVIEED